MPAYDYYCPANGQTMEVQHSMTAQLMTWGDLCSLLGSDPGATAQEAPLKRVFSAPMMVTTSSAASEAEACCQVDGGESCHPSGCACCG